MSLPEKTAKSTANNLHPGLPGVELIDLAQAVTCAVGELLTYMWGQTSNTSPSNSPGQSPKTSDIKKPQKED